MSNQPADNAPGKMGTQEASYIIAHDPKLTDAYARRFLKEKGLSPSSSGFENKPQSLKDDYNKTQCASFLEFYEELESQWVFRILSFIKQKTYTVS
jgi:hypothetical protein